MTELIGEACIATKDDGKQGAGIEVSTLQQADFGQYMGMHFLGFVDEQDGAEAGGL